MAKGAVELKKIELKVSVDCCNGCKKKVQKVLRNTEGVHKAELEPLQPKVTVIGNVEPQSIVKKLLKVGKHAEILSSETQTAEMKRDTEEVSFTTTEQSSEKSNYLGEQKSSVKASRKKATPKKDTSPGEMANGEMRYSPKPERTFIVHKSVLRDNSREVNTEGPHYYMVDPSKEALPYYAIHSYQSPPLARKCCSQEYCCCCCCNQTNGESFYQPLVPIPDSNIGDYFSDENTSGCHVM